MTWFHTNARYWRISFLLLFVLAISGPWWFDPLHVPAPFTCSEPNVRLDEDFCGLPLSITWFYSNFVGELGYLRTSLATNAITLGDAARTLLFIAWISLPLLPLLTTVLVILRGDCRCGYLLHQVGLGLVAVLVGLIGLLSFSEASWILWGLWLYIALALSMLLLEILVLRQSRRLVHE